MCPRGHRVWEQLPCSSPLMPRTDPISSARGEQRRDRGDRACNRAGHGRAAPCGRRGDGRRGRSGQAGVPRLAGRGPRRALRIAPSARQRDRGASGRAGDARGPQCGQADLGCPRGDGHGGRDLPLLRRGAGAAHRQDDPRRRRRRYDLPRAARGGRPDHALELPAHDRLLEGGTCARRRQHGRPEARGAHSADLSPAREDRPRRRHSRGSPQRRGRPWLSLRAAPRGPPRRRQGRLHGLDRGRPEDRRGRRPGRSSGSPSSSAASPRT